MLEFYSQELKSFLGMFIEYIRDYQSEYTIKSLLKMNEHEKIMSVKTYRKLREGTYFKDEDLFDQLICKLGYSREDMTYVIKSFFDFSQSVSNAIRYFRMDEVLRSCNAFTIKTLDLNEKTFALKELSQIVGMVKRVMCEFKHLSNEDVALLRNTYKIFQPYPIHEVINDMLFRYYAFTLVDIQQVEFLEMKMKESTLVSNQLHYSWILCQKRQYIDALNHLKKQLNEYNKSAYPDAYAYILSSLTHLSNYLVYDDKIASYREELLTLLNGESVSNETKVNLYCELAISEIECRDYDNALFCCKAGFELSNQRKIECYVLINHYQLQHDFSYEVEEVEATNLIEYFYNFYVKKNHGVEVVELERYLIDCIYPLLKVDSYLYKIFAYELYDTVSKTRNYKNLMLLKAGIEDGIK